MQRNHFPILMVEFAIVHHSRLVQTNNGFRVGKLEVQVRGKVGQD